jgi:release factor glutamine methyltransferase
MKNKSDNRESLPFDNSRSAKELVGWATKLLGVEEIESATREARWMFCHASGQNTSEMMATNHLPTELSIHEAFVRLIYRRLSGEPLQYVLGTTTFRNVELNVDSRVLIPRPETEALVDYAIKDRTGKTVRILDVGTGSGCIAISIKSEMPTADVWAIDKSGDALAVAIGNAEMNGASIEFRQIDLFDASAMQSLNQFDVIVSNPPYVPSEDMDGLDSAVRNYEPEMALTPGIDSLSFYRRLASVSTQMLNNGGQIVVEVHSPNAGNVAEMFEDVGLKDIVVLLDLAGKERVVVATNLRQ